MLKWRLISSAVIITCLLGLLYLDYHYPLGGPGLWLLPLGIIGSLMMAFELLDLWRDRADRPVRWPIYVAAPLVVVAAATPVLVPLVSGAEPSTGCWELSGSSLIAFALAVGLAFIGEMIHFERPGLGTQRVALSVLAISYSGLLMSFVVSLRLLGGHHVGMIALVSMVVVVKLSDTGAYFTGRLFGRHKMAPILSPGKTIQGAIGGVLTACLAGWLIFYMVLPRYLAGEPSMGTWWGWLLYGMILAAAGMAGDLAESLLKRDADQKDSSTWLPGLGGVLDILDSIVFAAPAAFFCWKIGLVGPLAGN